MTTPLRAGVSICKNGRMNEPVAIPFDLGRMFLGEEPVLFLLEIAFRTVVIYVYTLVLIRWIGSRSIAQLSLV